VAGLTVRRVIKSRAALVALVLLAVVIVGLPLSVKGDGTLAGQVRILLRYTLGSAVAVAGAVTLWIACGSVSREIEDRTAQLLLVKPVHRWEVWTGKWLGLLCFNAAVVSVCGMAVYAFLMLNVRNAGSSTVELTELRREILTARRPYRPLPEDVTREVETLFKRLQDRNAIPEDTCHVELRQKLAEDARMRRAALLPGSSREWRIDLRGRRHREGARAQLRFRLAASVLVWLPVSGQWEIGPADGAPLAKIPVEKCSGGSHVIDLPGGLLRETGTWTVRFVNAPRGQSGTAVFDMESPLELLVTAGAFETNLLRALSIALGTLGLVTALGLGTSALFSSPVSGFVACALIVMAFACHFFSYASKDPYAGEHQHHHGCQHEQSEPSALLTAGQHAARALDVIVAPTMGHSAFPRLSDGILISWGQAAGATAVLLVVYPFAIGLIATACLARREVALPG